MSVLNVNVDMNMKENTLPVDVHNVEEDLGNFKIN